MAIVSYGGAACSHPLITQKNLDRLEDLPPQLSKFKVESVEQVVSRDTPEQIRSTVGVTRNLRRLIAQGCYSLTGLWQPSVHGDVAFCFFEVGTSYH